jgi:GT2 family glycosyltransferase
MGWNMTDVAVIVLDIDGGAMLEECIASIRSQTVKPAELVVVDNASRVPVSERIPDVEVIRNVRNEGFARGANQGALRTKSPYVALVNNDVVLEPDWIAHVAGALDRDERLGAVQTIIRRPDGRIDGAGIDISDGTYRQIGYGQPVGSALAVPWGVSATATLYRRAAFGESMFDEHFFAYYEDVELSARLREQGWRVSALPLVKATHRGSATSAVLGAEGLRLRTRNRYLVARMHPGVGRVSSLLREDLSLLVRGRTSIAGVLQGLFSGIEKA